VHGQDREECPLSRKEEFHMLRRSRLAAIGGIVPLVLPVQLTLGAGASPVGAHSTEVRQGDDYVVTSAEHKSGYVCDREADGHAVRATWVDFTGHLHEKEEDKIDPGCDNITCSGCAASEVRLIEYTSGKQWCTNWHWT
jgi:hypothetical protein